MRSAYAALTIPGMPGMVGSHENWGNFKCHKWGELLRYSQSPSVRSASTSIAIALSRKAASYWRGRDCEATRRHPWPRLTWLGRMIAQSGQAVQQRGLVACFNQIERI